MKVRVRNCFIVHMYYRKRTLSSWSKICSISLQKKFYASLVVAIKFKIIRCYSQI
jgi:uncharacterized protein (DUF1800 family)